MTGMITVVVPSFDAVRSSDHSYHRDVTTAAILVAAVRASRH
jgi:hypothetical protein